MANEMKGVVGIFKNPDHLMKACEQVRDRRVKEFDAYTPFPVHGLEHAMGLKRSYLPWVTLCGGLTGASLGILFQVWTSAVSWPLNVGGKPFASLPAFVPVTFELTILLGGLSTAAALIFACKLPKVDPPILHDSLTDDQFALWISAKDPGYKESEFSDLMKKAGAHEVRVL